MSTIWNMLVQHWVGALFVAGYILLTGFNAMVAPGVDGGGVYGWFYRFTHSLAASPAAMGIEARVGHFVPGATATTTTTVQAEATQVK